MRKNPWQPKEVGFSRPEKKLNNQYWLEMHTPKIFAEVGGYPKKKINSLYTRT